MRLRAALGLTRWHEVGIILAACGFFLLAGFLTFLPPFLLYRWLCS